MGNFNPAGLAFVKNALMPAMMDPDHGRMAGRPAESCRTGVI